MIRLFAIASMLVFTPIVSYLSNQKFAKNEKKTEKKDNNGIARFIDVNLLKKCLIYNYVEREKAGELKKLRDVFDRTSRPLEATKNAFDINKKDDEIDEKEILKITKEHHLEGYFEDSDENSDEEQKTDIED